MEFSDGKTASAVNSALLPDNVNLPYRMEISQKVSGRFIRIQVTLSGAEARIETLISTLDEFVSHIHSVTQTLEKVESLHDRHKDPKREA